MVCPFDNLIQKDDTCKDVLPPMIDLLAFLSTASVGINIFRGDLIKHKLPNNLKPLVKDVLAELESEFLFRNDLNKRNDISQKK